ncbi:hypothetical protein B0H13DRAFT_1647742 [Mycena leptocephala]|nr:hypothetical protein B0H13DRAFT_1647742 [Mycena leptocephala]
MVKPTGANGHYNGTRPPDSVLGSALHEYSRKSQPLSHRLAYLLKDFGYKIGYSGLILLSTLKKLNREFRVESVKKPLPDPISSTLIAEVMANSVSSRNGPQTIQTQISLQDGTKTPR